MVLFDPGIHLPGEAEAPPDPPAPACAARGPFQAFGPICTEGLGAMGDLPPLPLLRAARRHEETTFIPREEDCLALWERYRMPGHIRRHSRLVADLAAGVVHLGHSREAEPDAAYAAGLLHDLAKGYCIVHGGSHSQMGAAWVMRETMNAPIAQAVLFHVHWPWKEEISAETFLPLALIYADKRVRHDGYVSLEDRFRDLLGRYGTTEAARARISSAHDQGKRIEAALSRRLGVNLREYTAHCRRLVL
jgi:predicted hydrolase (HD superfamily)